MQAAGEGSSPSVSMHDQSLLGHGSVSGARRSSHRRSSGSGSRSGRRARTAPVSSTRKIDVPTWDEVAANYPLAVRERIAGLVGAEFQPGLGGRLLLWHGVPGTGKTYALRALGWEWRSWCDFHYVTDPETFFGSSPAYMLDVLLERGRRRRRGRGPLAAADPRGHRRAARRGCQGADGPGPVAAPERRRRPDRPGPPGLRPGDDERDAAQPAPGRLAAGPVRLAGRVRGVQARTRRPSGSQPGASSQSRAPARSRPCTRARLEPRRPIVVRSASPGAKAPTPFGASAPPASVVSTASTRPLYGRGAGSTPAGGFTRS